MKICFVLAPIYAGFRDSNFRVIFNVCVSAKHGFYIRMNKYWPNYLHISLTNCRLIDKALTSIWVLWISSKTSYTLKTSVHYFFTLPIDSKYYKCTYYYIFIHTLIDTIKPCQTDVTLCSRNPRLLLTLACLAISQVKSHWSISQTDLSRCTVSNHDATMLINPILKLTPLP